MEEIPGFIFLGKGTEKLKGFTNAYLVVISAILTDIILSQSYGFYYDKSIVLTSGNAIDYMLSRQGALFMTVWVLIAGGHYVIVPIIMKILAYIARGAFISAGNLFFYSIYFIFTKILRLKAEKKFSFIREDELLNYALYLIRVCHYKNGYTVRNKYYRFYKWYVLNIAGPFRQSAHNVNLTTALLMSTLAVIYKYRFFELVPVIYYLIVGVTALYIINSIIAAWVTTKPDYFLKIIAISISQSDSLKTAKQKV